MSFPCHISLTPASLPYVLFLALHIHHHLQQLWSSTTTSSSPRTQRPIDRLSACNRRPKAYRSIPSFSLRPANLTEHPSTTSTSKSNQNAGCHAAPAPWATSDSPSSSGTNTVRGLPEGTLLGIADLRGVGLHSLRTTRARQRIRWRLGTQICRR